MSKQPLQCFHPQNNFIVLCWTCFGSVFHLWNGKILGNMVWSMLPLLSATSNSWAWLNRSTCVGFLRQGQHIYKPVSFSAMNWQTLFPVPASRGGTTKAPCKKWKKWRGKGFFPQEIAHQVLFLLKDLKLQPCSILQHGGFSQGVFAGKPLSGW